jgi:hypothetical protein
LKHCDDFDDQPPQPSADLPSEITVQQNQCSSIQNFSQSIIIKKARNTNNIVRGMNDPLSPRLLEVSILNKLKSDIE